MKEGSEKQWLLEGRGSGNNSEVFHFSNDSDHKTDSMGYQNEYLASIPEDNSLAIVGSGSNALTLARRKTSGASSGQSYKIGGLVKQQYVSNDPIGEDSDSESSVSRSTIWDNRK